MEMTNGISGNNTIDHFGHHPYAPGGPTFQPSWPRVPTELFTISSPQQRNHLSRVSRRIRMQEIIEERSCTPENLVIRPEEVLPLSNGSVAPKRLQPLTDGAQTRDINANKRLQMKNTLHTPNNTLDDSFTPDILPNHIETLNPSNLKEPSFLQNGVNSPKFLTNELLGISQSLEDTMDSMTTDNNNTEAKRSVIEQNGNLHSLLVAEEITSQNTKRNETTTSIPFPEITDSKNDQNFSVSNITVPLIHNENILIPKMRLNKVPELKIGEIEPSKSLGKHKEELPILKTEQDKASESPLEITNDIGNKEDTSGKLIPKKKVSIVDAVT